MFNSNRNFYKIYYRCLSFNLLFGRFCQVYSRTSYHKNSPIGPISSLCIKITASSWQTFLESMNGYSQDFFKNIEDLKLSIFRNQKEIYVDSSLVWSMLPPVKRLLVAPELREKSINSLFVPISELWKFSSSSWYFFIFFKIFQWSHNPCSSSTSGFLLHLHDKLKLIKQR